MKIDQDRMKHGKLIAEVIRQGRRGGIPWFVFTGANMKPLVTSDGPKGNIGFPVRENEIDYFIVMLNKVRSHITDEDVLTIQKALTKKPK